MEVSHAFKHQEVNASAHVSKVETSQADVVEQTPPVAGPQDDASPHLGDWIAFYAWLACFALLLATNACDLLRAVFNW